MNLIIVITIIFKNIVVSTIEKFAPVYQEQLQ